MKVPKGWKLANIGSVAQVNGQSHEACSGDSVAFLAMTDVSESGKVLQFQLRNQVDVVSGFTKFAESDVLVAKITPCFENGKGAHIKKLPTPIGYGSTEFHVLRAGPEITDAFLYLITRTAEFRRRGQSNMVGSAGQKRVQSDFIRGYRFPLPPLGEQRRIAEILGAWDEAIEKVGDLIQAKQKLKRALMQKLLTWEKRLPGFGPDLPDAVPLKRFAERVTRKNGNGCEHVLTASGEHGLVDQADYFNRSVAGANLSGYYLLKRGEFAYNRSAMNGYPYGAIKRLEKYPEGVLSTLYLCFAVKPGKANPDYLAHYFESGQLNRALRGITQVGARAHGLLNVNISDFMNLKIPLPAEEEQARIAEVLTTADVEITLLESLQDKLSEQKRGLMQQLLTGKKRINADAAEVKTDTLSTVVTSRGKPLQSDVSVARTAQCGMAVSNLLSATKGGHAKMATSSKGKRDKSYHVVPNPNGGWDVKKGGGKKASSHHDTKKEAVDKGRDVSRNNKGELNIHNKDGKIAKKDSHGNDPRNVPG